MATRPKDPNPPKDVEIPPQLDAHIRTNIAPKGFVNPNPLNAAQLNNRLLEMNIRPTVPQASLLAAVNRIQARPSVGIAKMPEEVQASIRAMKPEVQRFHGSRIALSWFPFPSLASPCADRFGYMSTDAVRNATKLPFNAATQALLGQLGGMMGDAGRDPNQFPQDLPGDLGNSTIPAGFTYFGQFVDHDITLDVSSSLDAATDANTINNMRTPTLDLDSVYGRGPGLDPFLYEFPSTGPSTAIKMKLGTNRPLGPGGPSSNGTPAGMGVPITSDVPRIAGTNTAVIGDPRNNENLIVSQFHHAMLRFHNAIVDLLVAASFSGDVFAEAKKLAIHHYQWAVVNDFLKRVCEVQPSMQQWPRSSPRLAVRFVCLWNFRWRPTGLDTA